MRGLAACIVLVFSAAILCGCVPAEQYENLKAERDELRLSRDAQTRKLEDTRKNLITTTTDLKNQINFLKLDLREARTELANRNAENQRLATKYRTAASQASDNAKQILALIDERNKLSATIIQLKGTIATLSDTVKELRTQLNEATKPQPGLNDGG